MNKLFITILLSFIATYSLGQEQGKVTLSKEETIKYLDKKFTFPDEFPGFNKTAFDGIRYDLFFNNPYKANGATYEDGYVRFYITYATQKNASRVYDIYNFHYLEENNDYNPSFENVKYFKSIFNFKPTEIVEIKDVNSGSLPSGLGELKIILTSNNASFSHEKLAHTSTKKTEIFVGWKHFFTVLDKREGLTNEINLYYFKENELTFSKIKKALEHLKDLLSKEDPF
jgi:hypothetical protein